VQATTAKSSIAAKVERHRFELSVRAVDFCQEFVYYRCPGFSTKRIEILGLDLRKFRLAPLSPVGGEGVVVVYVILDGIVTPIFRPLLRWVSRLRFVIRLQDIVAALPPYAILVLLAVPLAFAEPAKIYALVLMGEGHFASGLAMMGLAYLVSLVVAERIYAAGREKLRTITWFAKLMDWLIGNRDRLLAWGARRGSGLFP